VIVTAVDAATAYVVILKVALLLPAATLTVSGTVAAEVLLLVSPTAIPPAGAVAVNVTVPVELVPYITVAGLTLTELSAAGAGVTVSPAVCVDPP